MTRAVRVRDRRRGGTGQKRMSAVELLLEVDWLLGGGVSPEMVSIVLKRKPASLAQAGSRHGRRDIASIFGALHLRLRSAAVALLEHPHQSFPLA